MTPERFRALLESYGADLERWPEAERAAAHALLAHTRPELEQLLAEARSLDRWLDSHAVIAPGPALVDRVVADLQARHAPWWRNASWWPGLGLAGVGLAGSVVGALAVSVALRSVVPPALDWPERATGFSVLPSDWSEE